MVTVKIIVLGGIIVFCANCGSELQKAAKFCPNCGLTVEAVQSQENQAGQIIVSPENSKSKRKRNIILCSLVACALVVCVAVAAMFLFVERKVSDEQLDKDIKATYKGFLSSYNMNIVSKKVLDRKTDIENKKDEIYVQMLVQNDACEVTIRFWLFYHKYDDGWKLEDTQEIGDSVKIINTTVTEEDAYQELTNTDKYDFINYGTITLSGRETDLESGKDIFYYEITAETEFCVEKYSATVVYLFDIYGWEFNHCDAEEEDFSWSFLGQWHYNAGDANIWLNVISEENEKYKMEYTVQYNYSGWYSRQIDLTSNGVVEHYGFQEKDSNGEIYLELRASGYDKDGTYVEEGKFKVYPYGVCWTAAGAVGSPFYLDEGAGLHNSDSKRIPLSGVFAEDISSFDYVEGKVTDKDGNTYSGYFDLDSCIGTLYRYDTEIIYNLGGGYATFDGKLICDPENNEGDTIRIEIYCDDKKVYETEEMTPDSATVDFSLDITGAEELKILAKSNSREDLLDDDYHRPSVFLVDAYLEKP